MILGVIQRERFGVDDVRLVIASQRVRAVEDLGIAEFIVVFTSSLELIHGTWLRQNGEVHVLVGRLVRTTVLRPGEIDIAVVINTQHLCAARSSYVRGADELAVAVVGLHDHAGHRVVRTTVLHSGNVDLTDLGFLTRDDHMLLESLPRHRDRVTFDVLARPRVDNSTELRAASLGNLRAGSLVFRVVALPGVTYRVIGSGRSELLDLLIGQLCFEVHVSLRTRSSNLDVLVGLMGDVLAEEGLTDFHG